MRKVRVGLYRPFVVFSMPRSCNSICNPLPRDPVNYVSFYSKYKEAEDRKQSEIKEEEERQALAAQRKVLAAQKAKEAGQERKDKEVVLDMVFSVCFDALIYWFAG